MSASVRDRNAHVYFAPRKVPTGNEKTNPAYDQRLTEVLIRMCSMYYPEPT